MALNYSFDFSRGHPTGKSMILTFWKWITAMRNFIFDSLWYFELAKWIQNLSRWDWIVCCTNIRWTLWKWWNWFLFWWFWNNCGTDSDLYCRGQFWSRLGRNFATGRWRSDRCWGTWFDAFVESELYLQKKSRKNHLVLNPDFVLGSFKCEPTCRVVNLDKCIKYTNKWILTVLYL